MPHIHTGFNHFNQTSIYLTVKHYWLLRLTSTWCCKKRDFSQIRDAWRFNVGQCCSVGAEGGGAVNQGAVFLQPLKNSTTIPYLGDNPFTPPSPQGPQDGPLPAPYCGSQRARLENTLVCFKRRRIQPDDGYKLALTLAHPDQLTSEVCFCHSSLRIGAESNADSIAK